MPPIRIPTPTALTRSTPSTGQSVPVFFEDSVRDQAVKDQIVALIQRFSLERAAELIETNHQVTIDRAQMLAVWSARHLPRTEAVSAPDDGNSEEDGLPDKESLHPADALRECLLTPPEPEGPDSAALDPVTASEPAPFSIATDAPSTRTGPGQNAAPLLPPPAATDGANPPPAPRDAPAPTAAAAPPTRTGPGPGPEEEPTEVLPDAAREFIIASMARRDPLSMIVREVERKFGLVVDSDEITVCWRDRDLRATPTVPGPGKASRPKLSDEVKTFIVKRLACYETPSRIAAAVRIDFGIDIDRRRVFDYNPVGARPPAQRWIDLHAATRAQFLHDTAEIGVAQKVIRLRLLDRFVREADDANCHDRAARFLAQAARECGSVYEKQPRPPASKG